MCHQSDWEYGIQLTGFKALLGYKEQSGMGKGVFLTVPIVRNEWLHASLLLALSLKKHCRFPWDSYLPWQTEANGLQLLFCCYTAGGIVGVISCMRSSSMSVVMGGGILGGCYSYRISRVIIDDSLILNRMG